MQYFQNLEYEIKINIFKYVNSQPNLVLTCRDWSFIANYPYIKSEWLKMHNEKSHAEIAYQILFTSKVMTSRFLIHFGKHEVDRTCYGQHRIRIKFAFDILSANSHVVNYATSRMLRKNFKNIRDLTPYKRFVPFPPRLKALQLNLRSHHIFFQLPIPEEYPSENNKHFDSLRKESLLRYHYLYIIYTS
jgi:hypothetical protein